MLQITEVVKNLLIINVIMFIAFHFLIPQFLSYTYLFFPGSERFHPIQLVTHMFQHGSLPHLAFNMLSLYFVGPYVERELGEKAFLKFYLICGFAALTLHLLLAYLGLIGQVPIVGASGAIMGVFIGFAMLFPEAKMMLLFPPIPIKAKYLAIIFVAIDLFGGVSGAQDGIAHFAHLGGAIAGYLLIRYHKNNRFRK